jgi:hypothetical protein
MAGRHANPPDDKGDSVTVLDHIKALLAEMDLRYQQRFDAQTRALDAALLAAEKAVQTALATADRAVIKAETATEKRFDAVNEFRAAYNDVISQQMPRAEAEQRLSQLAEKIDELKSHDAVRTGVTTGANVLWGYLVGAVGIVAAIIAVIVR